MQRQLSNPLGLGKASAQAFTLLAQPCRYFGRVPTPAHRSQRIDFRSVDDLFDVDPFVIGVGDFEVARADQIAGAPACMYHVLSLTG